MGWVGRAGVEFVAVSQGAGRNRKLVPQPPSSAGTADRFEWHRGIDFDERKTPRAALAKRRAHWTS
uniref:Uncharacterized protein n=1 Tax=Paraburkholderia sprentiae WSM5005 TaxID=754502 RepID=A0A1I9YE70_9BURK